jgi:hypothetical protein
MPKSRDRIETLRQVILTEGLVQTGQDARINRIQHSPETPLSGLGKGLSQCAWRRSTSHKGIHRVALLGAAKGKALREELVTDIVIGEDDPLGGRRTSLRPKQFRVGKRAPRRGVNRDGRQRESPTQTDDRIR